MPPGPVLIHLHGGGFVQGGKSREGVVLLNRLAAHGWLCVSANYRLRRARDYGADPALEFLVGSSASSPASLAHRAAPPLLILHGRSDTAIPPHGPRAVAATLRSVSASPVVYVELPDTQHDFDVFASVRARLAARAVEQFLDQVRAGTRRP